jgi:chitin synthase
LVNAFGCSKTRQNGNASRVNQYLELHFTSQGRLGAAKLLTFGLDKSRLSLPLKSDERTFHIFYQLLAGATAEERETLNLQDVTSYALLASSGCYRLPGGPSSDDSIAMDDLRAAMKTLGFKQKQLTAIFSLLSAILLLGNLTFSGAGTGEAAKVTNPLILDEVAELLGVSSEELEQAMTTKSRMVRKEVVSSFLTDTAAAEHRDFLARDLYATLFAYVIESANHKVSSSSDVGQLATQIVQLDTAGFQNQAGSSIGSPPSASSSLEDHSQFAINFVAETVHNRLLRQAFDDNAPINLSILQDGVNLPEVVYTDNSGCVELLRGDARVGEASGNDRKPSGVLGSIDRVVHRVRNAKVAEDDEEALLNELNTHASHSSYSSLPSSANRHGFGINHYQGSCSYDVHSFITHEQDLFDSHFVQLLRSSDQPFLAKLFAGPSLATETHPLDDSVVVNAQVSIRPLRQPSPLSTTAAPLDALLDPLKPYGVTRQLNSTLSEIMSILRQAETVWTVFAIRPNDIDQPNSFDARRVKSQIRSMILQDLIARKKYEYVSGLTYSDFCERYAAQGVDQAGMVAGVTEPRERVQAFVISNAWRDSLDYVLGDEKIWLSYGSWRRMEDRKRAVEPREEVNVATPILPRQLSDTGDSQYPPTPGMEGNMPREGGFHESDELLLERRGSLSSSPFGANVPGNAAAGWTDEWDTKAGAYGNNLTPPLITSTLEKNSNMLEGRAIDAVEEEPTTKTRRWWLGLTWALTWWIPSSFLSRCGKMKRPDVQLAWREKVTICLLILFACGSILFYIIGLGKLLCPDNNRAWNKDQLSQHTASNSFYVAVRGKVYDISKFWKLQHSDSSTQVTADVMQQLAGLDLTPYFPVPLSVGCPGLVTSTQLTLSTNTSSTDYTPTLTQAVHVSGSLASDQASKLADINWYPDRFLPFMQKYYKGYYVTSKKDIAAQGNDKNWAIVGNKVYDISNYLWTTSLFNTDTSYQFLPSSVTNLFAAESGADITKDFNAAMAELNSTYRAETLNCLNNVFYAGPVDFRDYARCQVQNYLLLSFSILIMVTILAKFLAALQLTPKRNPEQQDKFVICQVPCYTEGEDELRKTIDSLAGLQYDDKRKLLFLICDGMIVGSGNELPTPRIVLDILGVDPKINPEPLMFKSVAEGSKQLNYGKVYSGLYEFEGHVVPYIVVVKVGRPSERSRPGNRGKRDTQVLLMRYLNRVHFDAPMYPLELEIYHQMKNVIGIDPAFYEYILTIDADTRVEPEGLNRLVAVAADDSSVIALCGETKLDNEEATIWTMIQVYEYYISHHLSKAFESLFGSVTCLPGCFSMYRIRSADKGKPLLISNRVIEAYSENKVDTLHKKNLLALGEDRFLTTLLLKNFPSFRTKFTPDAHAHTGAPDQWGVLLSQRRRWINSTIHNLGELVLMQELCGFCLFSMRFIVFVDLLGTILLPATTVYLIYLIVVVAIGAAPIPIISLVLIGAVYGLQMIIFLLKRQWQYMGWMLIYILAYPIWSFFLPIYSFWHMDDFSWGNTRIVVGEKGRRKIVAGTDEEPYDDSMIPLKRFSEYQRDVWKQPMDTGSIRSGYTAATSAFKSPFGNQNAVPTMPYAGSYYAGSNAGSDYGGNGGYYQNTNVLNKGSAQQSRRSSSNNLLGTPFNEQQHQFSQQPSSYGFPSMHGMPPVPASSMYGMPNPGSMYGMPAVPASSMYGMPLASNSMFGMSTPSLYGMPPGIMQTPQSTFGRQSPSASDLDGTRGIAPQMTGGSWSALPMSASRLSVATGLDSGNLGNPFAVPGLSQSLSVNLNSEPTDEDLAMAVRQFLAGQADLMQVSKRSVREAVIAAFPNAKDLADKKATINKAIDDTLSGAIRS